MNKTYLQTGTFLAALAVALGAFGAHGLKKMVPADSVATFQTGVQYQMYHALALLLVAVLFEKFPNKQIRRAGICFITGVILFSGSLYLLTALRAADQIGLNGIGIITPFGGAFFILGWLFLFLGISKSSTS